MQNDEEINAFNKEFLEIEEWAKQKDREFQVGNYPIKTSMTTLLVTLFGYGYDSISSLTATALATAELTGAYLWGKYVPGRKTLTEKQRKNGMENSINTFLKLNKLKPVKISNGDSEVLYTKFNDNLPLNVTVWDDQAVDTSEKKKQRGESNRGLKDKKSDSKRPSGKASKKRDPREILDGKSEVEDTAVTHATIWSVPKLDGTKHIISTADKEHVIPAWGNYAQPNTYVYLDTTSKSIQDFKAKYGKPESEKEEKKDVSKKPSIYEIHESLALEAHFVAQVGKQGNKKLEEPIIIDGNTYTHETKHKGTEASKFRFFAREIKANDGGATLVFYDKAGPALHKG